MAHFFKKRHQMLLLLWELNSKEALPAWKNLKHDSGSTQVLCGEGVNCSAQISDGWKSKVSSLINGVDSKQIFNSDETGLFCRQFSNKTLASRENNAGKENSQRNYLSYSASDYLQKTKATRNRRSGISQSIQR